MPIIVFVNVFWFAALCEGQYPEGTIVYRVGLVDVDRATEVLIVVDESSSMEGEHAWLPGMISSLQDNLVAQGIGATSALPNRYVLVGFGKSTPNPFAHFLEANNARVFLAADYSKANALLIADPLGSLEDGYQAIIYGLDGVDWRTAPNIARNLIFISDEDRDVGARGQSLTRPLVKRRLRQSGFIPNAVIDNTFSGSTPSVPAIGVDSKFIAYIQGPNGTFRSTNDNVKVGEGYVTTRRDYTNLALELGGAAWDINILRSGGNASLSFTNAFTRVKTSEIQDQIDRCQRCRCEDDGRTGMFRCVPDGNQARCICNVNNGTVSISNCPVWAVKNFFQANASLPISLSSFPFSFPSTFHLKTHFFALTLQTTILFQAVCDARWQPQCCQVPVFVRIFTEIRPVIRSTEMQWSIPQSWKNQNQFRKVSISNKFQFQIDYLPCPGIDRWINLLLTNIWLLDITWISILL